MTVNEAETPYDSHSIQTASETPGLGEDGHSPSPNHQKRGTALIYELIWVDPTTIRYGSRKTFSPLHDRGRTVDGDWDLPEHERRITNALWYCAIRNRIAGSEWEATGLYRIAKLRIEWDGKWLRHTSMKSVRRRLAKLDELIESIKTDGYLLSPTREDVSVNIARGGELRFNDGIHRLSIALALGIKSIPVQVVVRHPASKEEKER